MTETSVLAPDRNAAKGSWVQRLRLASGLVLFAFVLTHYLNHALGLYSVEVMEAVGAVRRAIWHTDVGTVLLYGALAVHAALALYKTARRRTWRIPIPEALQLVLGLIIPVMLIDHVVGTRGLHDWFDISNSYFAVLELFWPGLLTWQTVLLFVVWVHAVIGLRYWLRLKSWYKRAMPLLLTLAVLVPVLASLGWIEGARRIALTGAGTADLTREAVAWSTPIIHTGRQIILATIAATLLVALAGTLGLFSRGRVSVTYPGQRTVLAKPGLTLLEISRQHGIPHTSVCGGRARCSTCRTRIEEGLDTLPPPDAAERAVLERIRATPDVRLACQLRPRTNLTVHPMFPARDVSGVANVNTDSYRWGVEQPVAVLFVDLRGFTALSERRLAFDVMFILNEYLQLMSRIVFRNGGIVDKFIGDAVMALYGVTTSAEVGARQALTSAAEMIDEIETLNAQLQAQLGETLRIGIGIHAGPAILGRVGTGRAGEGLTALGDTVNIASRLESATKDYGVPMVASGATMAFAGVDASAFDVAQITVRGRTSSLDVHPVKNAAALRAALANTGSREPGVAGRTLAASVAGPRGSENA
ncbi:adenylate/guanylate cyclase domain-containing protein [Acuticoccus sp. MNP-M23]|uniref:adenylate/guanylate cyclase domain-containing protein n=1 Tax=Acuticoccus sp. MNP-M23 TaxID=3072793 RepID=UPI002814F49A|nr:adenylate/guanylate cyclase domain-containing protein [Acuticoccus sp. MNP-M23]WMS41477.1 adenylate/guanylate cyclase domain-containing protein [Acuticoccus sp. MNP-M23]